MTEQTPTGRPKGSKGRPKGSKNRVKKKSEDLRKPINVYLSSSELDAIDKVWPDFAETRNDYIRTIFEKHIKGFKKQKA